ncbi:hypothetical protein N7468_007114 [Penicillium chermesinum]|uniref:Uncharacterized protein n=1 Tax=Penicillium chermesinum TaxID=63820 RepID=A0A9W9TKG2_9EURO|nr:uncharacterized protein N7468_007114 [Penicillium chermesinum]KAJ5225889.1 hypothetical protein N7468_007114 [Penicillium chermesinum]
MAVAFSTPLRAIPNPGSDFTRPPDLESPTNFSPINQRPAKRASHQAPPLQMGGSTQENRPGKASNTLKSLLEDAEKHAKLRQDILISFAATVDRFVASQKSPESRAFAHSFSKSFIQYISTKHFATTSDHVPIQASNNPIRNDSATTNSAKSVLWAGIVKTPKTQGL